MKAMTGKLLPSRGYGNVERSEEVSQGEDDVDNALVA
jgi:hypothetical protein